MKQLSFSLIIFLLPAFFLFSEPKDLIAQSLEYEPDEEVTRSSIEKIKAMHSRFRLYKEVKYVAGADNKWFTADDTVYNYSLAEYDPKEKMIKKKSYTCGTDKIAFTADDRLEDYFVYEYDPEGGPIQEIHYKTNDQGQAIEDYRASYKHCPLGTKTQTVRYNSNGEVIYCIIFEHNNKEQVIKDVEYNEPGPDNEWFTSDDRILRYHIRDYDGQGKLTKAREYSSNYGGKGHDNQWFTADDNVHAAREFFYDKNGLAVKTLKYIGKGPDNQWFTEDDTLQYYTLRFYK